ncbi:MAG: class I lanthipeptide [Chryseobacterium sp.]|nr:class I lanthipeptide [Chryseobacterium sp.]
MKLQKKQLPQLKKKTITNLNQREMETIKGGDIDASQEMESLSVSISLSVSYSKSKSKTLQFSGWWCL